MAADIARVRCRNATNTLIIFHRCAMLDVLFLGQRSLLPTAADFSATKDGLRSHIDARRN